MRTRSHTLGNKRKSHFEMYYIINSDFNVHFKFSAFKDVSLHGWFNFHYFSASCGHSVDKTPGALAFANFNSWLNSPRSSNGSWDWKQGLCSTTFESALSTPDLEYSRFWGKLAWFLLDKRKFLVLSTYQWENSVVVQTVLHTAGALPGKGLQTLCWHNRILIGLRRKRYIRWRWETQLLTQDVARWMEDGVKYMCQ